jgi:hypothetical protein
MERNYYWKEVIQGDKVVLARNNRSYGINSYSRSNLPSISTVLSSLYKGQQTTLRDTNTHKLFLLSLSIFHEAFA